MILHHFKLRKIEHGQKTRLKTMYKKYAAKKRTNDEKLGFKNKLLKQKSALERAHHSGYVKKEAYERGKKRINQLLKKL